MTQERDGEKVGMGRTNTDKYGETWKKDGVETGKHGEMRKMGGVEMGKHGEMRKMVVRAKEEGLKKV